MSCICLVFMVPLCGVVGDKVSALVDEEHVQQQYFIQNLLKSQFEMIESKYGDRRMSELWSSLQLHMDKPFRDCQIKPSLVHGDLCPANFGETPTGPVLFDPSCLFAHSEFEFTVSFMEGGFHPDFFKEYHKVVPQQKGHEIRRLAYELFGYTLMWNHVDTKEQQRLAHSAAIKMDQWTKTAS